jgi:hypothetical protein
MSNPLMILSIVWCTIAMYSGMQFCIFIYFKEIMHVFSTGYAQGGEQDANNYSTWFKLLLDLLWFINSSKPIV